MSGFDIISCFPGFEEHATELAKKLGISKNIVKWDEYASEIFNLRRMRGLPTMAMISELNKNLSGNQSLFKNKTFILNFQQVNKKFPAFLPDAGGSVLKPPEKMFFLANSFYVQLLYDRFNLDKSEFTNRRDRSSPTGTVVKVSLPRRAG